MNVLLVFAVVAEASANHAAGKDNAVSNVNSNNRREALNIEKTVSAGTSESSTVALDRTGNKGAMEVEEISHPVIPRVTVSEHVCSICGKRCEYARCLALHMKVHRINIKSAKSSDTRHTYNCSKREFKTAFSTSLTRHNHLMHENKKTTDVVTHHRRHTICKDTKPTFKCTRCEFKTAFRTSLARHNRLMHESQTPGQNILSQNELQLNCKDKQGNVCHTSQSANTMLENTENEDVMNLEQTGSSPPHSNDQLSGNESTALSNSKTVGHVCTVCGKCCQFARTLALHMKVHSGTSSVGKNWVQPSDTCLLYTSPSPRDS